MKKNLRFHYRKSVRFVLQEEKNRRFVDTKMFDQRYTKKKIFVGIRN